MIACRAMARPTPEQIRDAIEQACRETALDAMYIPSIYAYVEQDEDEWPSCCNSQCEPCVLTLGHTARRALVLLERAQRSDPPA